MNKLITEIGPAEFEAIIDQFIERESQDMGELPEDVFYQALRDIGSEEPVKEAVEPQVSLFDSQRMSRGIQRGQLIPTYFE